MGTLKKFVSLALVCEILISISCTSITAVDRNPIEVGPHPGYENVNANGSCQVNYDAVINEMIYRRINTYVPTEEEYAEAEKILNFYNTIMQEIGGTPVVTNLLDENW